MHGEDTKINIYKDAFRRCKKQLEVSFIPRYTEGTSKGISYEPTVYALFFEYYISCACIHELPPIAEHLLIFHISNILQD
jgi:hypothetical protein